VISRPPPALTAEQRATLSPRAQKDLLDAQFPAEFAAQYFEDIGEPDGPLAPPAPDDSTLETAQKNAVDFAAAAVLDSRFSSAAAFWAARATALAEIGR
jgi:hypothetical protein